MNSFSFQSLKESFGGKGEKINSILHLIGKKVLPGTYRLPDWEGPGLGEVVYYSVVMERLTWVEEALGL